MRHRPNGRDEKIGALPSWRLSTAWQQAAPATRPPKAANALKSVVVSAMAMTKLLKNNFDFHSIKLISS